MDLDGLSHFKSKLDSTYEGKVAGKGLSTNDYTDAEKTKLAGIDSGAEVNVIESIVVNGTTATIAGKTASVTIQAGAIDSISVNGTAQTIDANKNVDITVPTNNNQLTNGAGYQTSSDVSTAISTAIAGVTQFDYTIVQSLPASGVKGTIYLMSNGGSGQNNYDEYIWINNAWEKLGSLSVDLSGYVQKSELVAITNAEINALFA